MTILIFLSLLAGMFLLPFWWTVISSLKPIPDFLGDLSPLSWKALFPSRVTLEHYVDIFTRFPLGRFLLNSLIVSAATTVLGLFVNTLAAYSLARFDYPGKKTFFALVLMTMMMPFEVIVIPLYVVCKYLKILNTYWALILPGVAYSMSIFLLRQFFLEIPTSLEESALIDGASWLRILVSIILPLSKAPLVTAALLQFTVTWNAFFWPLVAVSSKQLVVYQVGIVFFKNENIPSWGSLFAASTVGMLPVLVLFLCLQRYYIQGVSLTGLKE
ncbi:MAG: carbohydrate ABC transporter permease [Candidatus Methanomethyliaceae archaeon]